MYDESTTTSDATKWSSKLRDVDLGSSILKTRALVNAGLAAISLYDVQEKGVVLAQSLRRGSLVGVGTGAQFRVWTAGGTVTLKGSVSRSL